MLFRSDLQGGGQTVAPLGLGKVQHAGGSSGQGGTGASGPVVRRLPLGALIHLKMGVRVDEAGKDQLSGGVNKLAPLRREAGADLGIYFIFCSCIKFLAKKYLSISEV